MEEAKARSMKLRVLLVERKIPYHSCQEETSRFFVEIAFEQKETLNFFIPLFLRIEKIQCPKRESLVVDSFGEVVFLGY